MTLSSLDELYRAKAAIENVKAEEPELYENMLHVVSLTRQLQIPYHYMGCKLLHPNSSTHEPAHVKGSVLDLYHQEINKLLNESQFHLLREVLHTHQHIGYAKFSLLMLGARPEKIKGSTIIK
ncbi:hypothetical protein ACFFGV_12200 [Pontibacillus salicampi]|uniref:Uncharacterized protein n=1 Tax=Pontibacillus salicampi TaxID=1449801 RepID=A0ABV6LPS3_9BACI